MTGKQKQVYDYIVRFKEVNGYSPTIREIANGCNTKSLHYIKEVLGTLQDDGYISFLDNKPRTIRVLKFL